MPTRNLAFSLTVGAAVGTSFGTVMSSVSGQVGRLTSSINQTGQALRIGQQVVDLQNRVNTLQAKRAAEHDRAVAREREILSIERKIAQLKGKPEKRAQLGKLDERLKLLKAEQKEYNKLGREIAAANRKLTVQEEKYDRLGLQIGDVTRNNDRLNRSLQNQQRQMQRLGQLQDAAQKRRELHGRMIGLAATGYGIARGLGGAADFETGSARLRTVVPNTEALEQAQREALDFARNNLTGQGEVLEIQYALNSAGLEAEAARVGSRVVAKVATVTRGSAESVGEVVGTVFNNLGKSIEGNVEEKLARIGDVLTQTQLQYQIRDFNQLGESFNRGAAAAIKYQVSLEQTAVALGALNSAGMQGSRAGTSFNAVLRQMGKASEQFGFEIVRTADGQMDLIATLKELDQVTNGMDIDERAQAFQQAFGDEGSAVLLLLNDMEKLAGGYEKLQQSSKGATDRNYQYFLETTSAQMKIARNRIGEVAIHIGTALMPALNAVIGVFSKVTGWIAAFAKENRTLTQVIGVLALGIFSTVAAVTALSYAVSIGKTVWLTMTQVVGFFTGTNTLLNLSMLKTLIVTKAVMVAQIAQTVATKAAAAAQWLLNVAMTANPVGLIIAAIVVLVGIVVYMYKRFDWFRNFIQRFWPLFLGPIGWLIVAVKLVIQNWEPIKGFFVSVGKTIFKALSYAFFPLKAAMPALKWIGQKLGLINETAPKAGDALKKTAQEGDTATRPDVRKLAATATSSRSSVSVKSENRITVNAAPGMDESKLAEEVGKQLDERNRKMAAKQRGVMIDAYA